jgi:HPt (histidine-containing phosphotransfer) domain-containing protein
MPDAEPDIDPEVRRQIEELQELFRPQLAARVREIEEVWETVRSGGADGAALKRLHRLAHSLGGAAGTFGYPAVGDAARALERGLTPWLPGEIPATSAPPEMTGVILPLLATLAGAAAAAA